MRWQRGQLTGLWFLIYVLSATLVLNLLLLSIRTWGPDLEQFAMAKMVPGIWRPVVDDLVHRLFQKELRSFLVTTGFGLGIVVIGITLFPIKEKLSSSFEHEFFPQLGRPKEPPLWKQGLEEVKLAFLYILLQGMSFYLVLQGHRALAILGNGLSVGYLVIAMALDHCSPFFQRRNLKIHEILWVMLRRAPLRFLAVGALFIFPSLILEKSLPKDLNANFAVSILVLSEVLGMAGATIAGCRLGAQMLNQKSGRSCLEVPKIWTWIYRSMVTLISVWLGIFFFWWAEGAWTHANFMKCRYRPLWRETDFRVRETTILIHLPIRVENRSSGEIDPTKLVVVLDGEGAIAGEIKLTGPMIEERSSEILRLEFTVDLDEEALLDLPNFILAKYSAHLVFSPPLSEPVRLKLFPQ